jgi:hypothetical protein
LTFNSQCKVSEPNQIVAEEAAHSVNYENSLLIRRKAKGEGLSIEEQNAGDKGIALRVVGQDQSGTASDLIVALVQGKFSA